MNAFNGTFAPHRDTEADAHCELRSDGNLIGGATERHLLTENDDYGTRTLSMFGGMQALVGGSEVSLWCWSQFGASEAVTFNPIMAITLGGFQ
jgi:hypothetical protein